LAQACWFFMDSTPIHTPPAMVEFPYMYTYVHEGGPRNKKGFLPFYMVPWESNDCLEKVESRKVPLKIIHSTRASI